METHAISTIVKNNYQIDCADEIEDFNSAFELTFQNLSELFLDFETASISC